ncbi:Transcription initiation factor IIF subunit alpha [Vitis vinifera]|uniref:Transcription initiation factor IIF subunit alpha n=1 Tax=Vitis vinifera TaxID=29760 RepID=A0A438FE56_VITVI|nr:Transcription initiation factor IIF subunit alpha [Vitis vinifera]
MQPIWLEKYKNKPWLLEDETGQYQYHGQLEGSQSATYYLLMMQGKEFVAIPAGSWYNFNKVAQYKQLTLEEAEEKMKNRRRTADGYQRWMMKAANNGPAAFGEVEKLDDKETGGAAGGGRGRKKQTGDEEEGNVSDKAEEDEEEEAERKNRLGLNKRSGDDDEEGPRGGDHDLDDDDIEKGVVSSHHPFNAFKFPTICLLSLAVDRLKPNHKEEVMIGSMKKFSLMTMKLLDEEDEDDSNEEEGGLSKSGKELKKLLGKAAGMNDSDAEDDDDDEEEDEIGLSPVLAPKQKDVPKEEPADNSPMKSATASARSTPPTSKSSKGKRKSNGDDMKTTNGGPPKKVKTENKAPVTTQDLVAKFKARLKSQEDKKAFADILRRISKIQKTNGPNYVVLRDK